MAAAIQPEMPLPQDLAQCHSLIEQLFSAMQEQQRRMEQLEQRMQLLLQRIYGPRAERIDPNQLPLFGEEVSEQGLKAEPETEPEGAPETPKRHGHGRKRPSRELKRVRIEHEVPEADKFCAECNVDKKRIGEEITEQIEYDPRPCSSSNMCNPSSPVPAAKKA